MSDSGVVMSTVGKRRSCLARSLLGVSPVRSPIVHGGAKSRIGSESARAVSAAKARMGVSQITESGAALWRGCVSSNACSIPSQIA